jgi:trehalose utilization protein
MINVTIYNEFVHEIIDETTKAIYPDGIHSAIKSFLEKDQAIGKIRCAVLQDHRETLNKEVLDDTDVLVWWGHM